MGQTCCISYDKYQKYPPHNRETILCHWRLVIQNLLLKCDTLDYKDRWNNNEVLHFMRLFKVKSDSKEHTSSGSLHSSISPSDLASIFQLTTGSDGYLRLRDIDISMKFDDCKLALAFCLTSYVISSSLSDSTTFDKSNIFQPENLELSLRDFLLTLSICGKEGSSQSERLFFLYVLFADYLIAPDGSLIPITHEQNKRHGRRALLNRKIKLPVPYIRPRDNDKYTTKVDSTSSQSNGHYEAMKPDTITSSQQVYRHGSGTGTGNGHLRQSGEMSLQSEASVDTDITSFTNDSMNPLPKTPLPPSSSSVSSVPAIGGVTSSGGLHTSSSTPLISPSDSKNTSSSTHTAKSSSHDVPDLYELGLSENGLYKMIQYLSYSPLIRYSIKCRYMYMSHHMYTNQHHDGDGITSSLIQHWMNISKLICESFLLMNLSFFPSSDNQSSSLHVNAFTSVFSRNSIGKHCKMNSDATIAPSTTLPLSNTVSPSHDTNIMTHKCLTFQQFLDLSKQYSLDDHDILTEKESRHSDKVNNTVGPPNPVDPHDEQGIKHQALSLFSSQRLDDALSIFQLSSQFTEEYALIKQAFTTTDFDKLQSVYVVDQRWWQCWSEYTHTASYYDDVIPELIRDIEFCPDIGSSSRLKRRPNAIDNTRLLIPYTRQLHHFLHSRQNDDDDDNNGEMDGKGQERSHEYVLLPPTVWQILCSLYYPIQTNDLTLSSSYISKQHICRPIMSIVDSSSGAMRKYVDLYAYEIQVHWYQGQGMATESASDCIYACSCTYNRYGQDQIDSCICHCKRGPCTMNKLVERVFKRYDIKAHKHENGVDVAENGIKSFQSFNMKDIRIWVMYPAVEDGVSENSPVSASTRTNTSSTRYIPVLPYVTSSTQSTTPSKRMEPIAALSGIRPGIVIDSHRNLCWRLLEDTERDVHVRTILSNGQTSTSNHSLCRIMIESKDANDIWPLDYYYNCVPNFGHAPFEALLSESPEMIYKKGDEVFAKDGLNRWLIGEVTSVSKGTASRYNSPRATVDSTGPAATQDEEFYRLSVRFKYKGYIWEDAIISYCRAPRVIPLQGLNPNTSNGTTKSTLIHKSLLTELLNGSTQHSPENKDNNNMYKKSSLDKQDTHINYSDARSYDISDIDFLQESLHIKERRSYLLALLTAKSGEKPQYKHTTSSPTMAISKASSNDLTDSQRSVSRVTMSLEMPKGDNGTKPNQHRSSVTPSNLKLSHIPLSTSMMMMNGSVVYPFHPTMSEIDQTNFDEGHSRHMMIIPLRNAWNLPSTSKYESKSTTYPRVTYGISGLNNLGNTCYMNSALQCLSHAPMLNAFFLSGKYRLDLNRRNILGTGGKLADEFASLLQSLWQPLEISSSTSSSAVSQLSKFTQSLTENTTAPSTSTTANTHNPETSVNKQKISIRPISPTEFKKMLQKCKSQFSGHDQQDAQEFLSEILDALHEDLNKYDKEEELQKQSYKDNKDKYNAVLTSLQVEDMKDGPMVVNGIEDNDNEVSDHHSHAALSHHALIDESNPLTTTHNNMSSSSPHNGYEYNDDKIPTVILKEAVNQESPEKRTNTSHLSAESDKGIISVLEQGRIAWKKHTIRNNSAIVDLFQGQQCSAVTCKECGHASYTFDPYMNLSLPLPKQHEVIVNVIVLRKLPRLQYCVETLISSGYPVEDIDCISSYHSLIKSPIRMSLNLPRLADMGELKKLVCTLISTTQQPSSPSKPTSMRLTSSASTPALKPENINAAELLLSSTNDATTNHKYQFYEITRFLDDREPLATFVEGHASSQSNSPTIQTTTNTNMTKPEVTVLISENCKNLPLITSLPHERLNDRHFGTTSESHTSSPRVSGMASSPTSPSTILNHKSTLSRDFIYEYNDEHEYYHNKSLFKDELIVDINTKRELGYWPTMIEEFQVGQRVDALDHRGQWFSGNVMEIWSVSPSEYEALKQQNQENGGTSPSASTHISLPREAGLHLRVHFDNFSHKWDEWYGRKDIQSGKLTPVYTHSVRKLKVQDIIILHKRIYTPSPSAVPSSPVSSSSTNSSNSSSGCVNTRYELAGIPFMVQSESFRSCYHVYTHIVDQAMRYATKDEVDRYLKVLKIVQQTSSKSSPATSSSSTEDNPMSGRLTSQQIDEMITDALPFTVRMTSLNNPLAAVTELPRGSSSQYTLGKEFQQWEGLPFPRHDKTRPLCNIYHQRFLVVIEWKPVPSSLQPCTAITGHNVMSDKHVPSLPTSTIRNRFTDLSYNDHDTYKKHHQQLNMIASNSAMTSDSLLVHTARDRRLGLPSPVTLEECLRVYAGAEEHLDANTWHCERCKKPSHGIVKTSLSRIPDVLILHLKRFGMTARWREKIRTRVIFPLNGLDMTPYMTTETSEHVLKDMRHRPSLPLYDENVYDLYAVINHIGGMSGGHYTAYVKCKTIDIEEYQQAIRYYMSNIPSAENAYHISSALDPMGHLDAARYVHYLSNYESSYLGTWYLFDDEVVRPIHRLEVEAAVVSESAYILFYHRRRFSASTILNMTP